MQKWTSVQPVHAAAPISRLLACTTRGCTAQPQDRQLQQRQCDSLETR